MLEWSTSRYRSSVRKWYPCKLYGNLLLFKPTKRDTANSKIENLTRRNIRKKRASGLGETQTARGARKQASKSAWPTVGGQHGDVGPHIPETSFLFLLALTMCHADSSFETSWAQRVVVPGLVSTSRFGTLRYRFVRRDSGRLCKHSACACRHSLAQDVIMCSNGQVAEWALQQCTEEQAQPLLARYADDWRIVVAAYTGALLPWAILQASDYINERWKKVRRTFMVGLFHIVLSCVSLGFILFYVHVQRLSGDFKEMAAAIYAVMFCLFHVVRTLWGLLQLWEWKKWTKNMWRVWNSLGDYGFQPTLSDKYSVAVNSSLIDNQFVDTELPYRLGIPPFIGAKRWLHPSEWRWGIVPDEPAETIIRWSVTFIAHFGTGWLMQEGVNTLPEQISSVAGTWKKKRDGVAEILGRFLVCHTAGYSEDNGNRQVALFGALHPPYADALPYSPIYGDVPSSCLPFGVTSKSISGEKLNRFRQTLRTAVESQSSALINRLPPEEAEALQNVQPWHIYSFLQLIQHSVLKEESFHQPFQFLNLERPVSYLSERLSNQLGYSSKLPVPLRNMIDSLSDKGTFRPSWFQLQLDNILALRSGTITSNIMQQCGDDCYSSSTYELISDGFIKLRFLQTMRFQGILMEYVRVLLQSCNVSLATIDTDLSDESCNFHCPPKLEGCLDRLRQKSESSSAWQMLHAVLIMETQNHVGHLLQERIAGGGHDPQFHNSMHLQVLCLLSFPSIRVTREDFQDNDGSHVVVFLIQPVGGPQHLCVRVQISMSTFNGKISIKSRDGTKPITKFLWSDWKNEFLARLCAQSEWRQARHVSTAADEWIRSDVPNPAAPKRGHYDHDVRIWSEWPPFNPAVTLDLAVWKWMEEDLKRNGKSGLPCGINQFWDHFYTPRPAIQRTWKDTLKLYKEQAQQRRQSKVNSAMAANLSVEEYLVQEHNLMKRFRVDLNDLPNWIDILVKMRATDSVQFEYIEEFLTAALKRLRNPEAPDDILESHQVSYVIERIRYLIESDLDWDSFSALASFCMQTVYFEKAVPGFILVALESMLIREIALDKCGETFGLCLLWNSKWKAALRPESFGEGSPLFDFFEKIAEWVRTGRQCVNERHKKALVKGLERAGRLAKVIGAFLFGVDIKVVNLKDSPKHSGHVSLPIIR